MKFLIGKEVIILKKFFLRGLAEGLTGRSFVLANDINDVFIQFPELCTVRDKLSVGSDVVSGFCACDG